MPRSSYWLLIPALILGGCYLASDKPKENRSRISGEDRKVGMELNGILNDAREFSRDMNILFSTISRNIPQATSSVTPSKISALNRFIALLSPVEPEPLTWRQDEVHRSFERPIWNESLYGLGTGNRRARLLARGTFDASTEEISDFSLSISYVHGINLQGSEPALRLKRSDCNDNRCGIELTLQYQALAKVNQSIEGTATALDDETVPLAAFITQNSITANLEGWRFEDTLFSFTIKNGSYSHEKNSEKSFISAEGTVNFILNDAKIEADSEITQYYHYTFSFHGNIRNPEEFEYSAEPLNAESKP